MGAALPLVGGAVLGAIQGDRERSDIRRQNIAAAEANRFADVTGRFQQLQRPGAGGFGGAIKGAAAFAPLAGSFGGTQPTGGGVDFSGGGLTQNFQQPQPTSAFGRLGGGGSGFMIG